MTQRVGRSERPADFFKHIENRTQEAENAIFEYYRSEVKERFEDGYYDQYTKITNLDELAERKQIILKNVLFGFYNERKGTVRYGLLFDCEWNTDDGLGIRFGGKTVEIGTSMEAGSTLLWICGREVLKDYNKEWLTNG